MIILLIFAFLAGVVTVLSPCILPVLPAIVSAGTAQGKWRPLGVIVGLILSFTFFTLTLTALVEVSGISVNALRFVAMILIAAFGIVMIFPALSEWFAEKTASFSSAGGKIQSQSQTVKSGFWSGFILGIALGLIWTPCAGPILAAVTTLVATHQINQDTVLITLAYSIGAGIPMFLLAYGGNRIISSSKKIAPHAAGIRKCFGILMVLTAIAIATNLDVTFQQAVLKYVPPIVVEDNPIVREELNKLRSGKSIGINEGMHKAPDFAGIALWLNSKPLTMEQLRGKVVLIDFWTYSCINCIRTLPYIVRWYDTYRDKGLVVVGVHTPEFEFEKNPANVLDAIHRFKIQYPVALDNKYETWQAYHNVYWPAHYLVDQNGDIVMEHFGEGGYLETENAIRELLGMAPLQGEDQSVSHRFITPETYLGYARAEHYGIQLHPDEVFHYDYAGGLLLDQVGLKGDWLVSEQSITAKGANATLDLKFVATRVYLVLGGKSDEPIVVLLDGKPIAKYKTDDMDDKGQLFVKEPRKYDIVNLRGQYGEHVLRLHIPPGIKAYAFTFGDE